MTCRDIENNLPAYLEDLLPPEEKDKVREHLVSCPSCNRALEDLQKTETLLQGLPEVEPPPWLKQKIMTQVREEARQEKGFFRKLFSPWQYKIPLQTIALLFLAVLAFQIYREEEPDLRKHGIDIALPQPAQEQGIEKKEKPSTVTAPPVRPREIPPSEGTQPREAAKPEAAKPAKDAVVALKKEFSAEPEKLSEVKREKALEMPLAKQEAPAGFKGDSDRISDSQFPAQRKSVGLASSEAAKPAESAPAPLSAPPSTGGRLRESKAKYAANAAPVRKMHDRNATAQEITALLKQFEAAKIERSVSGEQEVLTADLPSRQLKPFLQRLEAAHPGTGKNVFVGAFDSQKETVEIRIEIYKQP
ncbi:MAG: hypothetical protein A4E66_00224 [Syntrophus sp. PtaB.Bin001]|nr:MAG: hypothetical protein A4E66_00224 [Syntrophus sp. PtaB.Bin001]